MKNFGKQSVPNGPSPAGMRFGGPSSLGASMAPAIRLEIGPEEREIASNQQKVLKGNDKFANLDDEDQKEALERRLTSILNEYIHAPNVQVRGLAPIKQVKILFLDKLSRIFDTMTKVH